MRFPSGPILRNISELDEPGVKPEEVLPVAGARVAWAAYEILQHDFPELRSGGREEDVHSIIDEWLIANAAFISSAQAHQTEVNTPIALGAGRVIAHRPPQYGRAFVASLAENRGLLDLKGAGVAPGVVPSHREHSNGLEYLAVAFGDLLLKTVIDEIFARTGPSFWTVPIYAILDLGFDLRDGWHGTGPAGLHVRRAHRRPRTGTTVPELGSIDERVKLEIEMRLRSYGITSTTRGGSLEVELVDDRLRVLNSREPVENLTGTEASLLRELLGDRSALRFERVNIQLARDTSDSPPSGQMFDFGHINMRESFVHPISSVVRDRPLCLGGVLWPDHPAFIQPDPQLQLPLARWDRPQINAWCFPLAAAFRNGEISRSELHHRLLEEPLAELRRLWGEE